MKKGKANKNKKINFKNLVSNVGLYVLKKIGVLLDDAVYLKFKKKRRNN